MKSAHPVAMAQRLVIYALFSCLGMALLLVVGQTVFLVRHWQ